MSISCVLTAVACGDVVLFTHPLTCPVFLESSKTSMSRQYLPMLIPGVRITQFAIGVSVSKVPPISPRPAHLSRLAFLSQWSLLSCDRVALCLRGTPVVPTR